MGEPLAEPPGESLWEPLWEHPVPRVGFWGNLWGSLWGNLWENLWGNLWGNLWCNLGGNFWGYSPAYPCKASRCLDNSGGHAQLKGPNRFLTHISNNNACCTTLSKASSLLRISIVHIEGNVKSAPRNGSISISCQPFWMIVVLKFTARRAGSI